MNRKRVEKTHEEFGAGQMDVGIGDGHHIVFDRYYDHMRIGRTDIVLDRKSRSRSRRGRVEPGMIELQCPGAIEASHEGRDGRPVAGLQSIGVGSGHHLLRAAGGKPVECFVEVHDQAMEARSLAFGNASERGDLRRFDVIRRLQGPVQLQHAHPLDRVLTVGGAAGLDCPDHGGHIVDDALFQLGEIGRRNQAVRAGVRSAHERANGRWVDAGRPTFTFQINRRVVAIAHMQRRGLQGAHAHLDAVVSCQALRDQRGQQHVCMTKLFNDTGFHAVPPSLYQKWHGNTTPSLRQIIHPIVIMGD